LYLKIGALIFPFASYDVAADSGPGEHINLRRILCLNITDDVDSGGA